MPAVGWVSSGPDETPDAADIDYNSRFQSTFSALNTLMMRRFVVDDTEEATATSNTNGRFATGTWKSIMEWGKGDGLDPEQEVAFQIMTATYVLTFIDEADQDIVDAENVMEQRDALHKLARRRPLLLRPLRLFVTGGAGAGKCKTKTIRMCICIQLYFI